MKIYKILAIDDEILITNLFRDFVKIWNIRHKNATIVLKTCNDAYDAITTFRKFDPDAVITDFLMPGLCGDELVEKLMTLKKDFDQMYVISAYFNGDEIKDNVRKVYSKPVDFAQVLDDIIENLEKRKS